MSFDEIVSLIIVGEIAVGKTCILSR